MIALPGNIPLDEVVHFDVRLRHPTTRVLTDGDSVPTFNVFEEANDTPVITAQTMVKRTSLTGCYRGSYTNSAANGIEPGKFYIVDVTAIVAGETDRDTGAYRCVGAEQQAGFQKVDIQYLEGGVIDPDPPGVHALTIEPNALNAAALNIDTGLKPVYTFIVQSVAGLTVTAPLGAHTTPQFYRWHRYKGIASDGFGQEGFIVDYTGGTTRQFTFDRAPVVPFVVGSTISVFSASSVNVGAWRQSIPLTLVAGRMNSGLFAIAGFTDGPSKLAQSAKGVVDGAVGGGATTTVIPTSTGGGFLSPTPTVVNQFGLRTLVFLSDTTTAALQGKAARIASMTSTGIITLSDVLTTAPVDGDRFVIV